MKIQHKVSNYFQKNEDISNASSEIHLDATYILLMLTQIKKCHFIKSGHSNKLCTDSITKKRHFPQVMIISLSLSSTGFYVYVMYISI